MSARGPVEVHIEELVLTGFDADAGELLGRSLRAELARLVAGGGGWPTPASARDIVRTDAAVPGPAASADATGREIARVVYGELGA